MENVKDVANSIIIFSNKNNISIDNLRLQKLLYFIEKEYIAQTDSLLFKEEFEAFRYGPVIKSIWRKYSTYGAKEIKLNQTEVSVSLLNAYFIESKVLSYSKFSTWSLVEKSHKDKVWNDAKNKYNKIINNEELIEFVRENEN